MTEPLSARPQPHRASTGAMSRVLSRSTSRGVRRPVPSHRTAAGPAFAVVVDHGNRTVFLTGELDVAGVGTFVDACAALPTDDAGDVVADLSGLSFIDAAGLGAVVRLRTSLRQRGHHLQVRSPRPAIRRTFTVAGLAQLLDLPDVTARDV